MRRILPILAVIIVTSQMLLAAEQPQVADISTIRVSLDVTDRDIREVLSDLGRQAGVDIAINPKIGGRITVHLQGVPLKTALKIAVGQVKAAYCQESRTFFVDRHDRLRCVDRQPAVVYARSEPRSN